MQTVAVVLSGCGVFDGAEIQEAVLTLLALDRAQASYQCLAPDIPQMHVVNHYTKQPANESRNVLVEAARIARGNIQPLDDSWVDKVGAVILPGGFGAAKNFSNYAVAGDECVVNPTIESFLRKTVEAGKPLGVICITPVVLARALKGTGRQLTLTMGSQSGAANSIGAFGHNHVVTPVTDCLVDKSNRIVSTPAYMCNARISEVAQGIQKLVNEVLSMMGT